MGQQNKNKNIHRVIKEWKSDNLCELVKKTTLFM